VPNLIGGALGRGFGERLRTGDGASEADTKSTVDRISEIAGEGLATMKARAAEAAAASKAAAEAAAAKADATVAKADAAVEKAAAATEKAAGTVEKAAAAKVVPNDGNVAQWAKWLAEQLRRIPDIQVYGPLTLNQLVDHGPASARAVWATAQAALGKDYGNITVTDLLKRFGP
jgi:hypothetical protein